MTEQTSQEGRSLSRQEFEKTVILRARTDPEFRQQLLADAKGALQAAYGIEIAPDVEIQVLEETPSRFYLVLPVASAELTDDQLAAVAGGTGSPFVMRADFFSAAGQTSSVRMR